MALTPDSLIDDVLEDIEEDQEIETSKTWLIDVNRGRMRDIIDDEASIMQYAQKAVQTAWNRFLIYSDQYGCEIESLIGEDVTEAYLDAEIPRMIRDALVYDERIEDVLNITYERQDTSLHIEARIITIFGDIYTEVIV